MFVHWNRIGQFTYLLHKRQSGILLKFQRQSQTVTVEWPKIQVKMFTTLQQILKYWFTFCLFAESIPGDVFSTFYQQLARKRKDSWRNFIGDQWVIFVLCRSCVMWPLFGNKSCGNLDKRFLCRSCWERLINSEVKGRSLGGSAEKAVSGMSFTTSLFTTECQCTSMCERLRYSTSEAESQSSNTVGNIVTAKGG